MQSSFKDVTGKTGFCFLLQSEMVFGETETCIDQHTQRINEEQFS